MNVLGEFNTYQENLTHIKLGDFLGFCSDFKVALLSNKTENLENLKMLFKLVCSNEGVSFPKFCSILKHIAILLDEQHKLPPDPFEVP